MENEWNLTDTGAREKAFELDYRQDGVYVILRRRDKKRLDLDSIMERLRRKRVTEINRDAVEQAAARADGLPSMIAPPQPEQPANAMVTTMVASDRMKAFMIILPPDGGRMLTADEMYSQLTEQHIAFGINREQLETMARYPVYEEPILIAEGIPPVNGQQGRVEFYISFDKDNKPSILEDGRVDFRELNLIECVTKGQKLCSLVAPTLGKKGRSVIGEELPCINGKAVNLPKGKNTEISEDGFSLRAAIDGQVEYSDGKVNVFATYEVKADVDNSTGNINFIGNVIVRGNVLSGFTIEAGGSVEVWGVAESAVSKAGGDIILRRGMQGNGKGILVSGGDIIARYIENCFAEAVNDIKSEAVMHSNVKCGNKLELGGRKGLLVGGSCKVGKEISAKVIGSHMATVTEIEVGVDPNLRERYKALREQVVAVDTDIRKADQAIGLLRKLEAAGLLTAEKQETLAKSIRTKIYYTNRIMDMKDEMETIESKLQQDAFGKVKAYNFIYPGTRVTIGTCMMYVKDALQYCILYRDGADVRVGPLDR